ncbi:MAG: hypothetical protein HY978_03315 [Candidatus Liptonbacteria bacterium]|nr:hypothetical protein [Candidatus Liptonbacteria bacterium]
MRKVILSVAIVLLLGTQGAEAATMSRTQMLALIQSLMKQVEILQKQLVGLNSKTPQVVYQDIDFDSYRQNPMSYLGKNIAVTSMPNDYLPRGASGGTTNYIEVINPADMDQHKIEMRIDPDGAYTDAVDGLKIGTSPFVMAKFYGKGVSGEKFTNKYGATFALPILSVKRVDRCIHGTLQTTILTGSSLSDIFSCTEWKQIAPKVVDSTTSLAPSDTTQITQNATSTDNPRHLILSGEGFCLQNPGVSYVKIGDQYVPDKNIDYWDGGRVSFTVPDSIPKGKYYVQVLGYNPNSGYCPGVQLGQRDIP